MNAITRTQGDYDMLHRRLYDGTALGKGLMKFTQYQSLMLNNLYLKLKFGDKKENVKTEAYRFMTTGILNMTLGKLIGINLGDPLYLKLWDYLISLWVYFAGEATPKEKKGCRNLL